MLVNKKTNAARYINHLSFKPYLSIHKLVKIFIDNDTKIPLIKEYTLLSIIISGTQILRYISHLGNTVKPFFGFCHIQTYLFYYI